MLEQVDIQIRRDLPIGVAECAAKLGASGLREAEVRRLISAVFLTKMNDAAARGTAFDWVSYASALRSVSRHLIEQQDAAGPNDGGLSCLPPQE